MKNTTIITLAALLLGTAGASAQTTAFTKPSGFVTQTLKDGQFNFVGLTLHESVAVAGAFETVAGTTLTDDGANFSTALTAGATYILEITDAVDTSLNGTVQDITTWSGSTITTPQNLQTEGLAAGDKYQLRASATLASVFGATNSAGLPSAASKTASAIVWVQDSGEASGFAKYYYRAGVFGQPAVWAKIPDAGAETTVDPATVVISYVDAMIIQSPTTGSDVDIVFTGAVKTTSVSIAMTGQFNYLGGSFPVGSTLQNSGLQNSITSAASAAASDVVWLQNSSGAFTRYYYRASVFGQPAVWRQIDAAGVESNAPADHPLPTSIIVQKNGPDANVKLTPGYNL